MNNKDVIEQLQSWSQEIIEAPNPAFGNLPICPLAKKARLAGRIRWEVIHYDVCPEPVLKVIRSFDRSRHDIIIIANPITHPSKDEFYQWIDEQITPIARPLGVECLGAYPDEPEWCINGWITRWPYQCILVNDYTLLKKRSDQLLKTRYYSEWTESQMKRLGIPRPTTDHP